MAIFGLVIFAALIPQAAATDMEPDFVRPETDGNVWEESVDGKTCEVFGQSGGGSATGFIIQKGGDLPVIPTLSLDGTALEITMVDECLHFRDGVNEEDRVLSARTRLYKYKDPNDPDGDTDIVAPYGPVIK